MSQDIKKQSHVVPVWPLNANLKLVINEWNSKKMQKQKEKKKKKEKQTNKHGWLNRLHLSFSWSLKLIANHLRVGIFLSRSCSLISYCLRLSLLIQIIWCIIFDNEQQSCTKKVNKLFLVIWRKNCAFAISVCSKLG